VFSLRSVSWKCFLCGLFTGYITKGTHGSRWGSTPRITMLANASSKLLLTCLLACQFSLRWELGWRVSWWPVRATWVCRRSWVLKKLSRSCDSVVRVSCNCTKTRQVL
jgi:hypothetical protein